MRCQPDMSCGSVMTTPQASLLGFPNPLLGIAGFTVVVVTGVLAWWRKCRCPGGSWTAGGSCWCGVRLAIFQRLYRTAPSPYAMVVQGHRHTAGGGRVHRFGPMRENRSQGARRGTACLSMVMAGRSVHDSIQDHGPLWDYWSTLDLRHLDKGANNAFFQGARRQSRRSRSGPFSAYELGVGNCGLAYPYEDLPAAPSQGGRVYQIGDIGHPAGPSRSTRRRVTARRLGADANSPWPGFLSENRSGRGMRGGGHQPSVPAPGAWS